MPPSDSTHRGIAWRDYFERAIAPLETNVVALGTTALILIGVAIHELELPHGSTKPMTSIRKTPLARAGSLQHERKCASPHCR
jgi:hypothetical protein